jgi:hypothetical protein
MAEIGSGSQVTLTLKQIFAICGSICGTMVLCAGALWGAFDSTVKGARDDISGLRSDMRSDLENIRQELSKLQDSAIAAPTKFSEAEERLASQMSDLRVELEQYRGELKATNASLEYLVQDRRNKK